MKTEQYKSFYLLNVTNCKQRGRPIIIAFRKNKIYGADTNFSSFIKPKSKTTLVYMILKRQFRKSVFSKDKVSGIYTNIMYTTSTDKIYEKNTVFHLI